MVRGGLPAELPVPEFYDPANALDWDYGPDQQRLFEAAADWRRAHRIAPAAEDGPVVHLLLVDYQKDFCFPQGSLFVAGRSGRGAMEDSDRVARFLYRNLRTITHVTCTMDTHFPHQIFSPAFWLDADGNPPPAHREVTAAEVRAGALRPDPAIAKWVAPDGDYGWLLEYVEFYCRELERMGKYELYLWPPHCLLGSEGHALAGVIHEARLFHSYVRGAPAAIEVKGTPPLTEYYSVIGPEVTRAHDGTVLAERNADFLEILRRSDAVIIAGQAASHCVKSTIDDLLFHLEEELARKVYILRDGMSSVTVPDPARPGELAFDFTPQAEAALRRFQDAGMHVVDTATSVAEWPDFPMA